MRAHRVGSTGRATSHHVQIPSYSPRNFLAHADREAEARSSARTDCTQTPDACTLDGKANDAHSAAAAELFPIIDETQRITRAIARIFKKLLADPKRSQRQLKEIAKLQRELLASDLFLDLPVDPLAEEAPRAHGGNHESPPTFVDSAPMAPPGAHQDAIRALFKRLVEASHPDKSQDHAEKARRTDVMKQLTHAYRSGDLAALLELERIILGETSPREPTQQTYEDLIRANTVLRKQERALDGDLRAMRAQGGELEASRASVQAAIAELRHVHEFIVSFRDGKISFKSFRDGPTPKTVSKDVDFLSEFMDILFADAEPRRKKRRR